jgi:hypothetical protein
MLAANRLAPRFLTAVSDTGSKSMTREEEDEAIYAVALVTRSELTLLGPAFARAWPVEKTPCFGELLHAIDEADRRHWQSLDQEQPLLS